MDWWDGFLRSEMILKISSPFWASVSLYRHSLRVICKSIPQNNASSGEITSNRSAEELFRLTFPYIIPQFRHRFKLDHRRSAKFIREVGSIIFLQIDNKVFPIESLNIRISLSYRGLPLIAFNDSRTAFSSPSRKIYPGFPVLNAPLQWQSSASLDNAFIFDRALIWWVYKRHRVRNIVVLVWC